MGMKTWRSVKEDLSQHRQLKELDPHKEQPEIGTQLQIPISLLGGKEGQMRVIRITSESWVEMSGDVGRATAFCLLPPSRNILEALHKVSHFISATILPTGYLCALFTDSFSDFHGALPTDERLSHVLYQLNRHIPAP